MTAKKTAAATVVIFLKVIKIRFSVVNVLSYGHRYFLTNARMQNYPTFSTQPTSFVASLSISVASL